jgi:hypothetical protein
MATFGRTPPCEKCLPEPMEGNREAFAVWEFCGSQVLTAGMGGAIDISFEAVEIALRRLNRGDDDELFFQVVDIARAYLSARKEKKE